MTPAQRIIAVVQTTLQDTKGVRWPATELAGYLTDGERELIVFRPDQNAVTQAFVPVAGCRQVLPSTALALIEVNNNTAGRRRNVRKVDMKLLDAVSPEWASATPDPVARNYMYDLRDPRVFWLYPPAEASTSSIELVVGQYPTEITASGALPGTVTGDLSVPEIWVQALPNYCLSRAYDKDAEYGGNAALSASYMAAFNAQIGKQIQSSTAVSPK